MVPGTKVIKFLINKMLIFIQWATEKVVHFFV